MQSLGRFDSFKSSAPCVNFAVVFSRVARVARARYTAFVMPQEQTTPSLTEIAKAIDEKLATDSPSVAPSDNAMPPAFEPHALEKHWYSVWETSGYFQPQNRQSQESKPPFVITIPPPNVTGVLHLGHALQHTVHDCLLRFHRMNGRETLCVPGTDHASIRNRSQS
jgi:arginyl-tRNA synthetase